MIGLWSPAMNFAGPTCINGPGTSATTGPGPSAITGLCSSLKLFLCSCIMLQVDWAVYVKSIVCVGFGSLCIAIFCFKDPLI
ncbi:hypothetical protein GDO86_011544 [Hymenochirus boettgeri]|uniref:Uncharacterized protein n=1 Tax=Hymenochirus boettgeri TaxID=247094 RepID=A0A8T2JC54_9PIPI|nr:hypothetical protein GDO86_011544 [Hymenochirus boettgeri]